MKLTRYVAGALVCMALTYTVTEIFRRRDIDMPEPHRESGPPMLYSDLYGEDAGS